LKTLSAEVKVPTKHKTRIETIPDKNFRPFSTENENDEFNPASIKIFRSVSTAECECVG
jgi:hypothetical protein